MRMVMTKDLETKAFLSKPRPEKGRDPHKTVPFLKEVA